MEGLNFGILRYFKAIFGLNSLSGSTADTCKELKPLPVFDPSVISIGGNWKGPIER